MLEINGALTSAADAVAIPPSGTSALRFGGMTPSFAGGSSDGVRPNWWNATGTPGATGGSSGGMLGMLRQIITAFASALRNGEQQVLGGAGPTSPNAPTLFTQATLGSTGDPHLSLTGTAAGSQTPIDAHFDSMSSHADLFSTPSFGGYLVSTTVGAPAANGVTTNASATAMLDHGEDAVTLNGDGTLAVTSGGRAIAVADGTSATLAGGATVTRGADGSVTIADANAWGRSLSTTFSAQDGYVNVTANAQNVALGGDVVSEALGH
jgi:hypothetical protein